MDSSSLSQHVYEQLHRKLLAGELPPGTQLVNRTLAAEFGTSTIPVREAISRLISEGVLDVAQGGGAFVRAPDRQELAELYEVREALEVLAVSAAASAVTDSLLLELRRVCEQFQQIADAIRRGRHATRTQLNRWLHAEEQFHLSIALASRNRWLVKSLHDLRVLSQIFAVQHRLPQLLTHELAQDTNHQHRMLITILEQRDQVQASEWMKSHIRQGRETVLARMAEDELRSKQLPCPTLRKKK